MAVSEALSQYDPQENLFGSSDVVESKYGFDINELEEEKSLGADDLEESPKNFQQEYGNFLKKQGRKYYDDQTT